ncbi:LuxR C-terminal-related transcriptional regulator [Enterobacter sp. NFIX58]|uniref:LuxR C-terminal-related transcriptional regulator n=1 Tax=Enterobacter sp. NFIX58 TaxID=1566251 RepID=UPI0008CAD52D|nr:LuxR C-terminal-related transcriptional regulator [Enterobacter sp. NFIX58]SEO96311.1 regulatory protein, luxR family [Enterobacter sp. NFIX58]
MNNISIHTKTTYVYRALTQIINNSSSAPCNDEKLIIIAFEEPWITLQDFISIQKSQAHPTLVIARKQTIHFLAAMLNSGKIYYEDIDTDIHQLTETVSNFMNNVHIMFGARNKKRQLTIKERRILSLYTSGYSVPHISQLLNISIKQIYNIKTNFMHKFGLCSDAGLIHYREIVMHACKHAELITYCY